MPKLTKIIEEIENKLSSDNIIIKEIVISADEEGDLHEVNISLIMK